MRMSELAVLTNAELSRLSHLITRLQKRGDVRRDPIRTTAATPTPHSPMPAMTSSSPQPRATLRLCASCSSTRSTTRAGSPDSAERINARIDDPHHNFSRDATVMDSSRK